MNLSKRTAKIGSAIPSRSEQHGDESVTALDIPLIDIMLDERELGEVMRQPRAAAALYNTGNGAITPFFEHIKAIAIDEKIEGASVTITHGVGNETIRLVPVKLAKIKVEPCVGGMTAMSCTVQCTPDLTEAVARLLGRLNSSVDIEIDGGDFGKQQDLPLSTVGDKDEPEACEVEAAESVLSFPGRKRTKRTEALVDE